MFGSFERLLAFRYLRARRKEGFVSVIAAFSLLGIFLGVGTLIVVMSVMGGFRQELLGRILGVNGHLSVYALQGVLDDFDARAERIRAIPGVISATPQVEGQVMVIAKGRAGGGLVRGVRAEDLIARKTISEHMVAGSLDAFNGEVAALIGTRMAENFGIGIGDTITILSPQFNTTTIGSVPRSKTYQIVGLFEVGMQEYDSSFVYIPLDAAQVFFQMKGRASAIEVFVEDPANADRLRPKVREAAGIDTRILDWQQANASFFNAIQVERNVMFLILSLIILVAAFNITSGQYMLVKGKGRDIAILRTMGATRGMVMRIFFLSGATIGVMGTALGVLGGVLFTENIQAIQGWIEGITGAKLWNEEVRFLASLPAVLDWAEVLQVVAMAMAIALLAPILPAWRAARLDPVEALRYE